MRMYTALSVINFMGTRCFADLSLHPSYHRSIFFFLYFTTWIWLSVCLSRAVSINFSPYLFLTPSPSPSHPSILHRQSMFVGCSLLRFGCLSHRALSVSAVYFSSFTVSCLCHSTTLSHSPTVTFLRTPVRISFCYPFSSSRSVNLSVHSCQSAPCLCFTLGLYPLSLTPVLYLSITHCPLALPLSVPLSHLIFLSLCHALTPPATLSFLLSCFLVLGLSVCLFSSVYAFCFYPCTACLSVFQPRFLSVSRPRS